MAHLNTKILKDGSLFWSYPANMTGFNHDGQDPNFLAAADFCEMHNILYDVDLFKTLKHMPEYKGFSFSTPGANVPNMRKDAAEISREFARLAEGSHLTVAVDYSRANSFFRKNELPEILSSENITHIRRLQLVADGYMLSYHSKDEWLKEQLHQWWNAAIKNDPSSAQGEIRRLAALISTDTTIKSNDERAGKRHQVYRDFAAHVDPEGKHTKLQKVLAKISTHQAEVFSYTENDAAEPA